MTLLDAYNARKAAYAQLRAATTLEGLTAAKSELLRADAVYRAMSAKALGHPFKVVS